MIWVHRLLCSGMKSHRSAFGMEWVPISTHESAYPRVSTPITPE
ncbi:protein of unknown function [Pararobbsia alpina]